LRRLANLSSTPSEALNPPSPDQNRFAVTV